jgi:hypothetical protein
VEKFTVVARRMPLNSSSPLCLVIEASSRDNAASIAANHLLDISVELRQYIGRLPYTHEGKVYLYSVKTYAPPPNGKVLSVDHQTD